ncbi:MAG: hypothetical protein NXI14_13230 [bacterium]|nr:hypothetical protein [bacterium]
MSRTEKHTPYEKDFESDQFQQSTRGDLQRKGVPREHAPTSATERPAPRFDYENFSDDELADRAEQLGIEGRDDMISEQLIEAIRKKEDPQRVDATRQADRAAQNNRRG